MICRAAPVASAILDLAAQLGIGPRDPSAPRAEPGADSPAPEPAPADCPPAKRIIRRPAKAAAKGQVKRQAKKPAAPSAGHHPTRAEKCKDCGAPRDSTPWPKTGARCLECARKAWAADFRQRHGAKKGQAKQTPPEKQVPVDTPQAETPHGVDRIKESLKRIDGAERPVVGGRVLPIIPD